MQNAKEHEGPSKAGPHVPSVASVSCATAVSAWDVAGIVAVTVLGVSSTYSELHGYKFTWHLLGPSILPCILLISAGIRVRVLCLALAIIWILRSAVLKFWWKLAIIGAAYYVILAFFPLGYSSTDIVSLAIAGIYGIVHIVTDLQHSEKVILAISLALMLRWNHEILTNNVWSCSHHIIGSRVH